MIDMVLKPGTIRPQTFMYNGQVGVQLVLLLLAGISIPCMLLLKPFILYSSIGAHGSPSVSGMKSKTGGNGEKKADEEFEIERLPSIRGRRNDRVAEETVKGSNGTGSLRKRRSLRSSFDECDTLEEDEEAGEGDSLIHDNSGVENNVGRGVDTNEDLGMNNNHEHGHSFGELMLHQGIETIEFSLATVSHTASYLRLWALSLAHSELAETFFNLTLKSFLTNGSAVGIIISYAVWFGATIGILLGMDCLEVFLHTLRLHW